MLFRAQNLGPLRDAEVDLSKDLIVLAGPNNSGKTYMAWSIYGLHRFRPSPRPVLDRWVRQLMDSPEHAIDLAELFAQAGPELLEGIATEYKSKLHLDFAAESAAFAGTSVSLRAAALHGGVPQWRTGGDFPLRATKALVWFLRTVGHGSSLADWSVLNTEQARLAIDLEALVPKEWQVATTAQVSSLPQDERNSVEGELRIGLHNLVRSLLLPQCTLFSADRMAVNIFAKELSLKRTKLVDEMLDADAEERAGDPMELVRRKAGRYPWPIRDSLQIANDLLNLSKEAGPFAPLADELESAILGGKIVISDTGDMMFLPRGGERHLQMHLTSSVVKSLASLVFYFRYLAERGDFIIIDEPELNLHPDNQRKIIRLLAKAVRLGFKVMMSTHSDYVLRELNHLIMLSKLPEGEAQTLGYDPKCALTPQQLGVYLFNDQHSEPVTVEDTGFSIKTIEDVMSELNADDQRFYARLFD